MRPRAPRNPIARALASRLFAKRVVRPKRAKRAYRRKGRTSRWLELTSRTVLLVTPSYNITPATILRLTV